MPTTVATFTPSAAPEATFSTGTVAKFVVTTTAVPTFVGQTGVPATYTPISSLSPSFDPTLATFSVPGGAIDVIAGSSILPTSGAGTQYLGLGTSQNEASVQVGVPQSTCRRLFVTRDVGPGVGKSIVYTLRKNGVDTGITVTLSGSDTSGSSSAATTVSLLAGDKLSIKQVIATSVARGIDNFVLEFQLT